jgi:hypothetical protein
MRQRGGSSVLYVPPLAFILDVVLSFALLHVFYRFPLLAHA